MRLLIFDTETTGLPKNRNDASEPNNWPHIVSISWVIFDTITNNIVKQKSYIIKPTYWEIPAESIAIHGITQKHAEDNGVNLGFAITEFMNEDFESLVAHNIEFDKNVLLNAILWDLNQPYPIFPIQICTMKLSKDICQLPGKYGYKYPKLKELYHYAFGRMPDETRLHGSLYDVLILTEIIQKYLPLRAAMGLVINSVKNTSNGIRSGRTLRIKFS